MVNKVYLENGYYLFKLENLLIIKKESINNVIKNTDIDYKSLKRLMNGDVTRVDITILARLCDYLDCNINDIFEYFPTKK